MATTRIIVGTEDCRLLKVTSLLKSSQSFHLFHDNWTLIAIDLETKMEVVKTLHRDFLVKTIGLNDIVHGLLEEWVARKSENATLHELAKILEDNGLKDCADSMVKGILEEQKQRTSENPKRIKINKYCRLPPGLSEFFSSSSKLCVLNTLDINITSEKLTENVRNYRSHDHDKYVQLLSSNENHAEDIIDVVKDSTLRGIKQLDKFCENARNKVVLVTRAEDEVIAYALKKATSSNQIELIHDKMLWNELTLDFQTRLTNKLEKAHGLEFEHMEFNGQLLVDLISEKEVKLFKETFPEELSYYVERTVSTRKYISAKIFEENSNDVFVFGGLDWYELSNLAKTKLTDTSSNQLTQKNTTIKYFILDDPNHFEIICEMYSVASSVHLLQYDNGRLQWIQSVGSLKIIQKYVEKSQDILNEKQFLSNLHSESQQPVIISDSPGMGKSILLGHFGNQLKRKHPDRLIGFIVLSEFVTTLKELMTAQINRVVAIKKVLEIVLCGCSSVGNTVLEMKMNSEEVSIELLFDGFDELESPDFKLTYDAFQTISSLASIRLWVTSRPHFLEELENRLGVLGFNIKPFEESHQIRFLSSYWSRHGQFMMLKLKEFATESLQVLKSRLNSTEQDIIGIPLQCLLLGQVFEEEAHKHANSEGTPVPSMSMNSITDFYKKLIKKKFEKYFTVFHQKNPQNTGEEVKSLKNMHVKLSLELVFPEFVKNLHEFLVPVQMDKVLNVGIVELSSTEKSPRFLHRTFAEYLLALFTLDIVSEHGWNNDLIALMFDKVLSCKDAGTEYFDHRYNELTFDIWNPTFTQYKFAYPAIADFFNSLVIDFLHNIFQGQPLPASGWLLKKNPSLLPKAVKIFRASAHHNFINILKFFECIGAFDDHSKVLYDHCCIYLAIQHSELGLFKFAIKHFEEHHKFNSNAKAQYLHLAVTTGNFPVVEFLVRKKGLSHTIKDLQNLQPLAQELLHVCVKNSNKEPASKTGERFQILRMLVEINRSLLEEKPRDQITPLLEDQVHVKLRIELLLLGANPLAQDAFGCTILHKLFEEEDTISPEDYHASIKTLSLSSLRQLLKTNTPDLSTPLITLLQNIDPLPETLIAFKNAEMDFNITDHSGLSVLATAIRYGRNSYTLKRLIEHGSNDNWIYSNDNTLLHIAAKYGNGQAAQLFIEKIGPNVKNKNGETPLDVAIKKALKHYQDPDNFIAVGLQLYKMGGEANKLFDSEGPYPLHIAAKKRGIQIDMLKFLIDIKINVNLVDINGNTLFHCSMEYEENKNYYVITQSLLRHGANPNLVNKFGETPFHLAVKNAILDTKTYQLLKSKTDVKWTPSIAHACLIFICQHQHENSEQELNLFKKECADYGVIVDWKYEEEEGNTLLHLAAKHQYKNAIKFLVEKKAIKLTSRNNLGQTVLHATAIGRTAYLNVEILKYLFKQGAEVCAKDETGLTFFHRFITRSSYLDYENLNQIIRLLIKQPCPDARFSSILELPGGMHGSTPLQLLVRHPKFPEKILILIKSSGIVFSGIDTNGNSILHYAIEGKRTAECLSFLLQFGADSKILNSHKHSVLHSSAQFGNLEALQFFLELGKLDVNGVDVDGNTPLHCVILQAGNLNALEKCKILVRRGAVIGIKNKQELTPLSLAKRRNVHDAEVLRILDYQMVSPKNSNSADSGHLIQEENWSTATTNELVVGSKKCPISKIALYLTSSSTFLSAFDEDWPVIAIGLETRRVIVNKLQKDLLLDKIKLVHVLYKLLEEWVNRESCGSCTLQKFCNVLENSGMKGCAESVLKRIQEFQTENKELESGEI